MDRDFPYKDIIDLPHHKSEGRKQMSRYDRAAQFAPFAALSGYDDVIAETGRLTDDLIGLTEDAKDELGRRLMRLAELISDGFRPEVNVTFFVPDKTKSGGSYENFSGEVKTVDAVFGKIIFYDDDKDISGKVVDIDMLTAVGGELFDE